MSNKLALTKLNTALTSDSVMATLKQSLGNNAGIFALSFLELVTSNSKLQQCNTKDLVTVALKAAAFNLPINQSLGFAYVIPRNIKGQGMMPSYQVGYLGYTQLALRTKQYKYINTGIVLGNWEVEKEVVSGLVTITENKEPCKLPHKGYFASFGSIDGFVKTLYWTKEKMVAHMKQYVPGWDKYSSPWAKDFDGMAEKTMRTHLLKKWGLLDTGASVGMSETNCDIDPSELADQQENSTDFDSKEVIVDDAREDSHLFDKIENKPVESDGIPEALR